MSADPFHLRLKTDIDMGLRAFASELLQDWVNDLPERLWVDRHGPGEPINTPFEPRRPDEVLEAWMRAGRPPYLRRSKAPSFEVMFEWRRERGKDRRSHPWSGSAFVHAGASRADVSALFRFLVDHLRPAWGTVSRWSETTNCHQVVFQDRIGTVSKYVGMDVGETLPGLHLETYFDAERVRWIGEERFARLPSGFVQDVGAGKLVVVGEPYEQRRSEALAVLGPTRFFDREQFDPRSLAFDDESARAIETAIERKRTPPA